MFNPWLIRAAKVIFVCQVLRACWQDESKERMSVVGLKAVLKERLRTL